MVPLHYIDRISDALAAALGEALRAVYLTGSAAVGALGPQSDVDVLVAVEGAERRQLEAVVAGCRHSAIPCPARKLELVVYELEVLAAPGSRPRWSLNLNTGEGVDHAGFDPDAEPAHWFVLDLAFARRHAKAHIGPRPARLIADPGDAAVDAALDEMVAWYQRHEPTGAAVAAARAEYWRVTGEWATKSEVAG